jgi:MFS family permease
MVNSSGFSEKLMHEKSPVRGISRNVFLISVVSFLTDISTEMLYPLIPLFLTATLQTPVAIVGIIEGLAELAANLLKGISGWLSDSLGRRRPFVIAGYTLAAVTKPLLALATGWPLVLLARLLDRFGKGVRGTARDALIADSAEPALRGRAFGFHRASDQAGAVLGPLLAMPLLSVFGQNYRAVFFVAAVPAAAGALLVLAVREISRRGTPPRIRVVPVMRSPAFAKFLFIIFLFSLGNSSDVFLILRAKQLGLAAPGVLALYALFNFASVISAYPVGILSDRIGRKALVLAGWILFVLVYCGLGIVETAAWLVVLFLGYGFHVGMSEGMARALVVDLVPTTYRATALGLHSTAIGCGGFAASVIAGLLWHRLGPAAPFFYGGILSCIASLLLATFSGAPCAKQITYTHFFRNKLAKERGPSE